MTARLPILTICAACFSLLGWNPSASAHHRDWHQGGGNDYKQKQKDDGGGDYKRKRKGGGGGDYKRKRKGGGHKARRGGGPPPWAPAHGYRAKYGYRQGGRYYEVEPSDLVRLPGSDTGSGIGSCNRETLGALLGGAVGGAAGSQVGSGSGKTAAVIAGTIIGALIGGDIGRTMDKVDQNCIGQALEQAPTGQAVGWQNPEQGGRYQVTPTNTYQTSAGQYCREYQTSIIIGGRTEQAVGSACRQADGSWQKTRY